MPKAGRKDAASSTCMKACLSVRALASGRRFVFEFGAAATRARPSGRHGRHQGVHQPARHARRRAQAAAREHRCVGLSGQHADGAGGKGARRRSAQCRVACAEARVAVRCATGGAQAARTWRGRILAPEIPPSDSAACAYATLCPCLALGENYQRRVLRRAGRRAGRAAQRAARGPWANLPPSGASGLQALTRATAWAQSFFAAQVDDCGARAAVVFRHDGAVDYKRAFVGGTVAGSRRPAACVRALSCACRTVRRLPSTGSVRG